MDYENNFLNPDEEFELRYSDEMEVLREMEQDELSDSHFGSSKKFHNIELQPVKNNSITPVSLLNKSDEIIASSEKLSPLPLVDINKSYNCETRGERLSFSQEPSCSSATKRSVQDLFGDIDDIDFESSLGTQFTSVKSKRLRLTDIFVPDKIEDKDSLTISRILDKRRNIHTTQNTILGLSYSGIPELCKTEVILTRRVPKYSFVTLRNGNNEKFYAKLHSDDVLNSKIMSVSEACKTFRLLSVPFENILAEANAILDKKFAQSETTPKNKKAISQLKSDISDLWVQKYKPASYFDLLSDENTNRTLLKWMKLWDKIVFGREPNISSKSKSESDESKYTKKNYLELDEELDDSGLPKFKIVLLCGPPGLGKTTLAHLIAHHAGYNPVEMNASDDRSPDIFKQQLEAATQMKAVIGKNPKPNCLIIDEIDGAPAPSIDVLIKFAKGELRTKMKKKSVSKNTGKLKRPIICICNDMYVPALRTLRQMAFVIQFPPTTVSRLANRLLEIARAELIITDSGAMMTLCEKANNDIRTCLSTMYCLKDRPIRLSTIHKMNIGNKDMQKGLFSVWQDIFQIPDPKAKVNIEDAELKRKCKTETEYLMMKRMRIILKSVQGNGDYDRLAQGVYENFLRVKISDSSMKNVSKGLSWFCFMDKLKTNIVKSQIYTLMSYLPYPFVVWGYLFANYQRSKINYPSMMYELSTRQTKYFELIQEILKGMEPKIRAYCHHEQLLLDTLPFFMYILNPELRAVNIQLFTNAEKQALRQLIDTMIDYNLNFVQERTQNGNYEFTIDPNIDEVVEFPDIPKTKHLIYSSKMMISREIEQEKLRRLDYSLHKLHINDDQRLPTSVHQESCPDFESLVVEEPMEINPPKSQNHLQKLTPKIIKKSPSNLVSKDFFGRVIDKPLTKSATEKVDEIVKSDIWFHFKEGFSNAVRRSVYIKDLLQ